MAAVNIPVVIDIKKAFDDAARRVDTASKPMRKAIEDATANIHLKIGTRWDDLSQKYVPVKKALKDIIGLTSQVNRATGTTTYKLTSSLQELSTALDDAKTRYSNLMSLQGKGLVVDTRNLDALRESITILSGEIEQRTRYSRMVEESTQKKIRETRAIDEGNYALIQEAKTISQLRDKISSLRGMLDNLDPKANKKLWNATVKEIQKATKALEDYERRARGATNTGAGSVGQISAEMQKIVEQWNLMSKKVKFDPNGNLSKKAQDLVDKYKQLTAESEKYGRSIDSYVKKAVTGGNKVVESLNKIGGAFGVYLSVHSLVRFVRQIRDVTGELEYQRVALGHLIQDEEYGNQLFGKIVEAAKQSPFRITQLVTYTKQLAAYRIEEENLYDTTMRLADISAGLGVDMNRLILAYGQVRAASVLRGQELRQFTEAGIPLVELLAEKFRKLGKEGTTTADVFKLISERAVPFEYIKEIFEELTDAGGMFYKMQAEQADTLKGRWIKLKDAYDQALMSIGDSTTFRNWNDVVLSILNTVAKNLQGIIRLLNAGTMGWIAYKIATASATKSLFGYIAANVKATISMIKMFGVSGTLRAGFIALGNAWKRFTIALSTNWVGLALGVFATLITYFTTFKDKIKGATDELSDMEMAIKKMAEANKQFEFEKNIIEQYENLQKTTDKTTQENELLANSMDELKKRFPELADKIGDENIALEEQVALLDEAAKLRHQEAVDEAKKQLTTQNDIIRGLEDDEKVAKQRWEAAVRREEEARLREEEAKKQRAEQNRELAGTPTVIRPIKELIKETTEAANAAKAARAEYDEIAKSLADARKEAQKLEMQIDPKKKEEDWKEWQKQIAETQNKMLGVGDSPVFTKEEIGKLTSVYDLFGKLKKRTKDLKESLEGMQNAFKKMIKGTDAYVKMEQDITKKKKEISIAEAIAALFGFDFSSGNTTGYQADPFLAQMRERIKFMQDFKKGYDDLQKYMTKDAALLDESKRMKTRGLALGISESEQQEAAEQLIKWYQKARERAWAKAKEHGATGTLDEFLSREIKDTTNRGKALRDFQKLIQSLFDAETELDLSEQKKQIEKALKKLKEEIKRSETAKKFFEDIFQLTGDQQLAANMAISVYGDPGSELAKRIKDSISGAMQVEGIKEDTELWNKLVAAAEKMDFRDVMKDLEGLPDGVKDAIKEASAAIENYNRETLSSYAKLLMKFDEVRQKSVDIENKANKDIEKLREGLALEIDGINKNAAIKDKAAAIQAAKDRVDAVEEGIIRERDLQLSRLTKDYRLFFSSIGVISEETARKVANNQKKMLTDMFVKGEISLTKYKRELKEIDAQLEKYYNDKGVGWAFLTGGTQQSIEKVKEYGDSLISLASTIKAGKGGIWTPSDDDKRFLSKIDDVLNMGAFTKIFRKEKIVKFEVKVNDASQKAYNKAIKEGKSEAQALKAASEAAGEVAAKTGSEMAAGASKFAAGMAQFETIFYTIDSWIKFIEEDAERMRQAGGYVEDWGYGLFNLNRGLVEGYEKFKSGDMLGAMTSLGKGLQQMLHPIQPLNNAIEEQSELLERLEYSYSRLDSAIEKAFGTDYIQHFNGQLAIMEAQASAYREQARLEREKGKNADEKVAKGYERQAREVEDKIKDSQSQLAEFFAGTDVTSAATDFANAWIEAYKEFGSTSDALSEKFEDMIQNMVVNSMAAKIVQDNLKDVFKLIDDLAKGGGELSVADAAIIANRTKEVTGSLNSSLTNLMTALGGVGLNLRSMGTGLTGIARDIQGASEESILGLAAGVNTQNYYMQHIDMNVAMILAALTGTAPVSGAPAANVADPYRDQMLAYVSSLPQMRDDMASIRVMLERVIRPNGSPATHYVAAKM